MPFQILCATVILYRKNSMLPDQSTETYLQIAIPDGIKNDGPILGAAFTEFGETQCLTIFNHKNLYFLEIVDKVVARYSSYNIPKILDLISVIKGYLLVLAKDQKLWLFQLKKLERKTEGEKPAEGLTEQKPERLLVVESFLKQSYYQSYSMREVTPNMIELFIVSSTPDRASRLVYIYQFTVNQKVGGMGFTLDKNYKITSCSRKHLYASKSYYDPSTASIIKLRNFSDSSFSVRKIDAQYLYAIPVGKSEEFYCLNKNYELFQPENVNVKVDIRSELSGFDIQNATQYLNYLLLRNDSGQLGLFVVEESMKVKLLALESNSLSWKICFNGRLVGIKPSNNQIVVTQQLHKKSDRQISLVKLEEIKAEQISNKKTASPRKPQQKLKENPSQDKESQQTQGDKLKGDQQKNLAELTRDDVKTTLHQNFNQKIVNGKKKQKQPCIPSEETRKRQEPETSKHKSNFKPAKIIGRKDLKKQKNEKVEEEKRSQASQCSGETQMGVKEKQECKTQNSQQSTHNRLAIASNQSCLSQEIPKEEKYKQQKKNDIIIQKKDLHSPDLEKQQQSNVGSAQSPPCIQTLKNLSEEVQMKINSQAQLVNSPFAKKVTPTAVHLNFVPPVTYKEIFGVKDSILKEGSSLLFKGSSQKEKVSFEEKQQQQPVRVDLKDETVQENGEQKPVDKQVQLEPSVSCCGQQEILKPSPLAVEQEKRGECCLIFQETRHSLNNFGQKILSLQTKSEELKQQFKNFQQEVSSRIQDSMKGVQEELIQISKEKSLKIINLSLENSVNEYFSRKLTPKVSEYFKSIMGEGRKIYENTIKYYSEKKKQSIISLQNHFQEQEHLVREMKLISADMLTSVQNTINEGQEAHAYLLKQWGKCTTEINVRLDHNSQSLDNHMHDRSASERQKIIDSLSELREAIQATRLESQEASKELLKKQERPVPVAGVKKIKQKKHAELASEQPKKKTKSRKAKNQRYIIQQSASPWNYGIPYPSSYPLSSYY